MRFRRSDIVEQDADYTIYSKKLSGRITKKRYILLSRWARRNTRSLPYCGHEWDCCGCLSRVSADVKIISKDGAYNGAEVTYRQDYNY
jgi:hypothetical protein